jgi:hypothetical protein
VFYLFHNSPLSFSSVRAATKLTSSKKIGAIVSITVQIYGWKDMGTLSALLLHLKVYLIFFNILHAWLIKLGVMWNCYFIVNLMKLQATTVA